MMTRMTMIRHSAFCLGAARLKQAPEQQGGPQTSQDAQHRTLQTASGAQRQGRGRATHSRWVVPVDEVRLVGPPQ